jgi:hypothetical protein
MKVVTVAQTRLVLRFRESRDAILASLPLHYAFWRRLFPVVAHQKQMLRILTRQIVQAIFALLQAARTDAGSSASRAFAGTEPLARESPPTPEPFLDASQISDQRSPPSRH